MGKGHKLWLNRFEAVQANLRDSDKTMKLRLYQQVNVAGVDLVVTTEHPGIVELGRIKRKIIWAANRKSEFLQKTGQACQ